MTTFCTDSKILPGQDGTISALVASGAKWKKLISIGLLMGIIGGVCGNYFGIGVAYLVRMVTGG